MTHPTEPAPPETKSSASQQNTAFSGKFALFAVIFVLLLLGGLWGTPYLKVWLANAVDGTVTGTPLPSATSKPTAQPTKPPHPTQIETIKETSTSPGPSFLFHPPAFQGHSNLHSLALSPDGAILAMAAGDSAVTIWDTSTKVSRQELVINSEVDTVSFSPDGSLLAAGSRDGKIRIFDTTNWTLVKTLSAQKGGINIVTFSADGSLLASGSNDTSIAIWYTYNWEIAIHFADHISLVYGLAFSPDHRILASAGYLDDQILIHDIVSSERLQTLIHPPAKAGRDFSISEVFFSPEGKYLASRSSEGSILIWDTNTWASFKSLQGGVVIFLPNGNMAVKTGETFIQILEIGSWHEKQRLSTPKDLSILICSLDGKTLVGGTPDGVILIWKFSDFP